MSSPHRSLGPMYFTYGIVFACGCSFAYQPSLVILGHYFNKRLGLVNGIVTAGSSIFTITLPIVLSGLLENVGIKNTMRVLCILMFVLMLAGLTYKPLLPVKSTTSQTGRRCPPMNKFFNINIWKSLGYRIWAFGVPAALYGYFVPYVHLVSFCFLLLSSLTLLSNSLQPTLNTRCMFMCYWVSSPHSPSQRSVWWHIAAHKHRGAISQYSNPRFWMCSQAQAWNKGKRSTRELQQHRYQNTLATWVFLMWKSRASRPKSQSVSNKHTVMAWLKVLAVWSWLMQTNLTVKIQFCKQVSLFCVWDVRWEPVTLAKILSWKSSRGEPGCGGWAQEVTVYLDTMTVIGGSLPVFPNIF